MARLRDIIGEVLTNGLRATNAEINQDAIDKGLITPRTPDTRRDTDAAPCRAGFERLHATLTSDGPK